MNQEIREERLRLRNDEHRRYGFGEDEVSQLEAKEERIRARKERYKRMGYEIRDEDNVSSSLLLTLSSCVCFTDLFPQRR